MRRRLFHRRTSAAFSSLDGLLEFVDHVGGFPSEVGILATEPARRDGFYFDDDLDSVTAGLPTGDEPDASADSR